MDITLQVRTIDLVSKFLKHDFDGLPHYGYTVQKPAFLHYLPENASTHFPRSTPEKEGLSSFAVKKFVDILDKNNRSHGIHSLIIMKNSKVISENFWAPYKPNIPHMLYSLSKTFTGTAIGMLMDEGLLLLDEKICDIFRDELPRQSLFFSNDLKDMTVRHLLTMTSGSRFNELGSVLDGDWIKMFLESSLKFEPGEEFDYNSLNTYMLSAIVVKRSGMSLSEFLRIRLFEPLGIASYNWEKCPKGIEKGGWGLALTLEDAMKLGDLYLNKGVFDGKRILSEKFIKTATINHAPEIKDERKHGYGYQLWIGEKHGAYHFNGAFGQYVIVIPKFNAVIGIYSGNVNLFSQNDLLAEIYALFEGSTMTALPEGVFVEESLKENEKTHNELLALSNSLRVLDTFGTNRENRLRSYECECSVSEEGFEIFADSVNNKEYRLTKNTTSFFPLTLQAVHNNFSLGCDMVSFKKDADSLSISIYEHIERNTLTVKANGGFAYSCVAHKGEKQLVGTRGVWSDDGKTLFILCSFIETPDTRIIKITLEDDGTISMVFDEIPTVDGALSILLKLVGLSERALFKGLIQSNRDKDMPSVIRSFTMPTAVGIEIKNNTDTVDI